MGDGDVQLLTSKDVAKWLNISERSVTRLVEAGELRAHRIGGVLRYDPEDVRRYIERTATSAAP